MKPVLARQMEVYAGFMEHTDHHVGRLIDSLEDLDILDDTLIYVIIGDNGASAEGSLQGCFNEMAPLNGVAGIWRRRVPGGADRQVRRAEAYNHYAVGWAHAMDTPYQWTKQVASHFGGTRNGTIVHWPNGIKAKGEVRNQFHHVIDVAPTILEAAGLPAAGVRQRRAAAPDRRRVSMAYSFDDAKAAERHETQYFEMSGNRGIYHKGWTAVTRHRTPWVTGAVKLPPFDDDVWELYDTNTDWTQSKDLAKEMPDKLPRLQRLWLIEAVKYNVLPLDDRFAERANPDIAGRPQLVKGNRQLLFGGMGRLTEELDRQLQEQVARDHRRGGRARDRGRGRHRRGGRQYWRLEPVCEGRQADLLLQLLRREPLHDPRRPPRFRRGSIRSGWSSSTTAGASPRAATSPCSSTARKPAKAGSRRPSRWSFPPTRRWTSGTNTDHP